MLKVLCGCNVSKFVAKGPAKFKNFSCSSFKVQKEAFEDSAKAHQPLTASPEILVEKDTNITLIGLNRPQKRNAIDAATAHQLFAALDAFEADVSSPVAVLYGIGGSFCAGHDLAELENQSAHNFLFWTTRRHLRKPLICGINGFCVGSGLELALLGDLRVMEDTAVIGCFQRRFGVPLSDDGTARLAAVVGYSRALDIIATGCRVGGKEAFEIGLVNRLVATGTSLGQAVNLAFSIAKFPLASLLQDRAAIYASVYERLGFRASVQREVKLMSREVLAEMREGVKRFRDSELKGPKTDSWHVKEKSIPDWEENEILHELAWNKLQKSS